MSSVFNLQTTQSLKPEKTSKQAFIAAWRGRALYNQWVNDPHVQQAALRVLGVLGAAVATTLMVLSLCSIAVVGQCVIIPLCILTSIFSFLRAKAIHDEQEARGWESVRKDIANLSLKEIAREYSWDELFVRGILSPEEFAHSYRQQVASMSILQACQFYEKTLKRLGNCACPKHDYYVPLPNELREKWTLETQNMTFEQIIETYPIAKLNDYHILSEREFDLLTELNGVYQTIKSERDRNLSFRFPEVETRKRALEEGFAEIEAAYRKDPAVQRFAVIDAECNAKRDAIINRYAQLTRQETEAAYAPYQEYLQKHQGQYLAWLKKEVRAECELLKNTSAEKEREIAARLKGARNFEIGPVEERYGAERIQLSASVHAAKETRDAQIAELRAKIKDEIASDQQSEERFQNLVKSLNAQFAARRYVLKMGL